MVCFTKGREHCTIEGGKMKVYICDPKKNVDCQGYPFGCKENGGLCNHTKYKKYSIEAEEPKQETPKKKSTKKSK